MLSNKTKRELKIDQRQILIDSIEIGIPSTQQILTWGERILPNGKRVGLIKNSKTVNYKRFTPFRDGLFCERIFGPVTSFVCACGKKQPHNKVTFCEKCEVEYIDQRSRRYRLGYISLLSPVTHIWYLKGRPSYLSLFLGKRKKNIVALAYCNSYLIEHNIAKKNNNIKTVDPWSSMRSTSHTNSFLQGKDKKSSNISTYPPNTSVFKQIKTGSVRSVPVCRTPLDFASAHVHPVQCTGCKSQLTGKALINPLRVNHALAVRASATASASSCPYLRACRAPLRCKSSICDAKGHGKCFALASCKSSICKAKQRRFAQNVQIECANLLCKSNVQIFDLQSNAKRCPVGASKGAPQLLSLVLRSRLKGHGTASKATHTYGTRIYTHGMQKIADVSPHGKKEKIHFFKTFFTNTIKKKEVILSTSYRNSSYTRQHTLPFLPTLTSHFYLRDALLHFIYSSPVYEDIPVMEYCGNKRWEPLRDVHTFMAHKTVEKDLANWNKSSIKNRYKRKPILKGLRSYKTSLTQSSFSINKKEERSSHSYEALSIYSIPGVANRISVARRFARGATRTRANLLYKSSVRCFSLLRKTKKSLCFCFAEQNKGTAPQAKTESNTTQRKKICTCNALQISNQKKNGTRKEGRKRSWLPPSLKFNRGRFIEFDKKPTYETLPGKATSFFSETKDRKNGLLSGLELTAIREILSYTGGGALQQLLQQLDQHDLCKFLFAEAQILRVLYETHLAPFSNALVDESPRTVKEGRKNKAWLSQTSFSDPFFNNHLYPTFSNPASFTLLTNATRFPLTKANNFRETFYWNKNLKKIYSKNLENAKKEGKLFIVGDKSDFLRLKTEKITFLTKRYRDFLKDSPRRGSSDPILFSWPFSNPGAYGVRCFACVPCPFILQSKTRESRGNYLRAPTGQLLARTCTAPQLLSLVLLRKSKICTRLKGHGTASTCTYKPSTSKEKKKSESANAGKKISFLRNKSQNIRYAACTALRKKGVISAVPLSCSANRGKINPKKRESIEWNTTGFNLVNPLGCLPKAKKEVRASSLENSFKQKIFKIKKNETIYLTPDALQSKVNDIRRKQLLRISRRIYKVARRLKVTQLLTRNHRRPEWMILSHLPVLPPELRPILQMSEKVIVASDLNIMYQRVIYRNNRHLRVRFIDFHLVTAIQRLVQDAVDRLIENGKGGSKPYYTQSGRPLKSLSDILKGKKGRFRLNLLGKRVDFSGRSVIVVSPSCKIHECGLPKEIALELYHYFLLRQLILKKHCASIVTAKKMIKAKSSLMWDILRELMYHHPVLLNRAPTLHRLGIQAFQPKLVLGNAILLHPLVCSGFNADFDGDQMGVHLPLSFAARAESWDLLWSRNNLLSPATGQPMLVPSQDMVLGFYYITAPPLQSFNKITRYDLTRENRTKTVQLKQNEITPLRIKPIKLYKKRKTFFFLNTQEVTTAFQNNTIKLHHPVWLQWNGKIENEDISQIPLEVRVHGFGVQQEVYEKHIRSTFFRKERSTGNDFTCVPIISPSCVSVPPLSSPPVQVQMRCVANQRFAHSVRLVPLLACPDGATTCPAGAQHGKEPQRTEERQKERQGEQSKSNQRKDAQNVRYSDLYGSFFSICPKEKGWYVRTTAGRITMNNLLET